LDVKPTDSPRVCELWAGDVKVCDVLIDADYQITSGDESFASQADSGDEGDEDSDEEVH
jgi:hypothetical protein